MSQNIVSLHCPYTVRVSKGSSSFSPFGYEAAPHAGFPWICQSKKGCSTCFTETMSTCPTFEKRRIVLSIEFFQNNISHALLSIIEAILMPTPELR
jgi:hypothetical protein